MPSTRDKTLTAPAQALKASDYVWVLSQLGSGPILRRALTETIVLGRGDDADWVIDDPQLSRRHARLTGKPPKIGDLGSHNGTFVDGQRCESAELHPGSVVRVGQSLFGLHMQMSPELPGAEPRTIAERQAKLERVGEKAHPVLITGETGVGKERAAEVIHKSSGRTGKFVAINCGAISPELIESELFGHTKGAFSGADTARTGLIAQAKHGTLFLDEVAELPLSEQAALLRVLQEGKLRPVGSDQEIDIDVRVVSATHQNLPFLCSQQQFRPDLMHRLMVLTVNIEPLRTRKEEILPIFGDLLKRALAPEAAERLLLHAWPGNIRELQSAAYRLEGEDDPVTIQELENVLGAAPDATSPGSNASSGDIAEADIKAALQKHGGVLAHAARTLGLHRNQLYRLLAKHKIKAEDFRSTDT